MKLKTARRKPASIASNSRWIAYTTAGAATALGCVATSEASIVSVDVNQTFNAAPGGVIYNTFALGVGSIGFYHLRGSSGDLGISKVGIFNNGGALRGFSSSGFGYASKLAFGANIAGGAFLPASLNVGTLAFGAGFANSQWLDQGTGYVGFRFTDAAGTEYGWASVTADGTAAGNSFTLNSYAYTTAGELITAGQVPEPGSLGLLALGGAGLVAWRKRRAKAATASLPA